MSVSIFGKKVAKDIAVIGNRHKTTTTHNNVTVNAGDWYESEWIDCDGFNSFGLTLRGGTNGVKGADIHWSADKLNYDGTEPEVIPYEVGIRKAAHIEVKARYAKVSIHNGEGSAEQMTAKILLKV